jgi:carotenoid cleavage dioxygenase-like enzyme
MDKRQLSHDILNFIERLRIMHDMALEQKYEMISKEELIHDLEETLSQVDIKFKELLQ